MATTTNQSNTPFFENTYTQSSRIIHTPSTFARSTLIYLQEVGELRALWPHVSARDSLDSYLFFVVMDGRGELKYKGQRYELSTGDCVFIDCNEGYEQKTSDHRRTSEHGLNGQFDELWSLSWAHFNGASMKGIYTKYRERGGKPVFSPNNKERYVDLVSSILATASSDSYVRDMQLSSELMKLLTYLMEDAWPSEDEQSEDDGEKKADNHTDPKRQLVRRVKDYIDENYQQSLTLQTLAGSFYVNKQYLAKLFKDTYGFTVNGYIAHIRVSKAKEMLRFTDMTVSEIGCAVGIKDVNYFSRVFKRLEGVAPGKYRESW